MLPTAKNQKKRLTNRTGRCTIQLSTNRVTPLCPCHPPVGYSPFYPTTHHHRERYGAPCGPSWGGRKSSRKAALSSFPGEYLPHAAGQTARRQQRAAAPEHRSGAAAYCRHFKRGEGALLQFRVPSFCRNRACTPGGGARRAPAGSAAGHRPAAAARHPGPRPAGAYHS